MSWSDRNNWKTYFINSALDNKQLRRPRSEVRNVHVGKWRSWYIFYLAVTRIPYTAMFQQNDRIQKSFQKVHYPHLYGWRCVQKGTGLTYLYFRIWHALTESPCSTWLRHLVRDRQNIEQHPLLAYIFGMLCTLDVRLTLKEVFPITNPSIKYAITNEKFHHFQSQDTSSRHLPVKNDLSV